jgi:hypothetical protein
VVLFVGIAKPPDDECDDDELELSKKLLREERPP